MGAGLLVVKECMCYVDSPSEPRFMVCTGSFTDRAMSAFAASGME